MENTDLKNVTNRDTLDVMDENAHDQRTPHEL